MTGLTSVWAGPRRPWLLALCAFLAVLVYLTGWTAYATNGLTAFGRLDQRPPGAFGWSHGAEYRLVSLQSTTRILDQDGSGSPQQPIAGTSFVVAEIEVTRREEVEDYFCSFQLIGPDRRRWDSSGASVDRKISAFCHAEEMPLGKPVMVEAVFQIPDAFLGQIYGVAVPDNRFRIPTQIIQPAA